MRLSYEQEYRAVVAFAWLMRAMPRRLALAAGAAVGQLGWLTRLRRGIVLSNMKQALPELSDRQRRRIAARSARNFGRTVVEFVRFVGRDRLRLKELVAVSGLDELTTALEEDRGAIVVTGHLGAWALYVTALSDAGVPTALLVGRQKNPLVDAFIHTIPGEHVTFISKGRSAPRGVLRCLADGMAVVMVADQRSRVGIPAPFFGRETLTLALPGAIVARRKAPLVLMAGHRVAGARHEVVLRRLDVPPAADEDEMRRQVAILANQAIAEAVLEHPDQYFWYHRRWRDSDASTSCVKERAPASPPRPAHSSGAEGGLSD